MIHLQSSASKHNWLHIYQRHGSLSSNLDPQTHGLIERTIVFMLCAGWSTAQKFCKYISFWEVQNDSRCVWRWTFIVRTTRRALAGVEVFVLPTCLCRDANSQNRCGLFWLCTHASASAAERSGRARRGDVGIAELCGVRSARNAWGGRTRRSAEIAWGFRTSRSAGSALGARTRISAGSAWGFRTSGSTGSALGART